MKPLEQMPDDLCSHVEGVVFDIDDTITREGRVEREAYDALWSLREARVHSIAVTGRPLGWCDVWARTWPVDAVVGENGAGWAWRRGAVLHRGYADDEQERARQRATLEALREHVAQELPEVTPTADDDARRCDLAFDIGETVHLGDPTVARLAASIEMQGARAIVSSVHAHAMAGDWDKARGARSAARAALGVDLEERREQWVFVGDSGNDAAAFEWFPHTVGVANVRHHLSRLPTPPRWVTHADRGRGFAELAERVLRDR